MTDRVMRACKPETIEDDLDVLWRELADKTPATRTIMSNLVVFQACSQNETVDLESPCEEVPIAAVAQRHPSRVIVLLHEDRPGQLQRPVAAAVGILLFGPEETRVAIEQITVRSVTAEESLPSIVRRFVLGDLPTSVWWTNDLSQTPPLTALVTMGRQFVYDSRQWRDVRAGLATIAALLDHPHAPDLVDLNWRRLAPMRKALEHGFQGIGLEASQTPVRAHIRHHPNDLAKAWLLIGWLASKLDRDGQRRLETTVEQHDSAAQTLSVAIEIDGAELSAEMDAAEVLLKESPAGIPLAVKVPLERLAEAVASELQALGRDIALTAAIRSAHQRLTSGA